MLFLGRFSTGRSILAVLFFSFFLFFAQSAYATSTITGMVFDKQRNVLSDVDVELLNDYYQQIQRTRTDGSGRYSFGGLVNGRYSVRVLAFRYDLEDQTLPIEINAQNIRGGEGSEMISLDFFMVPRKGGMAETELSVVFAQDVPVEAKRLYNKALDDLAKKRNTEGIVGLSDAVKAFPTYYLALSRLGKELFILGKYPESAQAFMQAVQINEKSATSFYYLASSLSKLGKEYNKAALTALKQAVFLAPNSPQILYLSGKLEREEGNYAESEKHLLAAKKASRIAVPEIHKELAQLYSENLKQYSAAAEELESYMKASKLSDAEEKSVKKIIAGLKEKAKS